MKTLARLLIAIALLAAWQAALVHPLKHVDTLGGYVHLGGADPHPDKSELCDALAALTACAAQGALGVPAIAPRGATAPSTRYAARQAEPPPFLSQAPPALL
jgi:hypothetical protein